MNGSAKWIVLTLILSALQMCPPAAVAVVPGARAPSFELPYLDGGGYVAAGDLFSTHALTFLVFWDSGCAHCVDALRECEEFNQQYAGGDIAIVGINTDEGNLLQVRSLLEANRITFAQLQDRGGRVAAAYEVPFETFALYLVSGDGIVRDRRIDPQDGIVAILEEMLEAVGSVSREYEQPQREGAETAAFPQAAGGAGGFVFEGYQRIRFLAIDATGDGAVGPYGEGLQSKNNLLYRFDLEISKGFGRYVTAGALLRISNEGEEVLETGPRYLGSQWGSAFAEARHERLSLRLGYYPISMTPLTLMRWDWDDNPRTGGDAGCGCGAAAGVLLVESLEDLGPELVFEGALASYSGSNVEARLFYAVPRRTREINYFAFLSTAADPPHYSLEIYGFDARWQRYDSRTNAFWKAGVRYVGSWENRRSVDFKALRYPAPDPWFDSSLLTVSLEAPVIGILSLRGEWIAYNGATEHRPEGMAYPGETETEGRGGIAGIVLERSPRFTVKCDYLRLDPGFYSPFAAISYEPDVEGVRASTRFLLPGDLSVLSLFYKRMREAEVPAIGAEREQISFFGASVDVDLDSGLGGSVGWLDKGVWRSGALLPVDQSRQVLALSGRYRFGKNTYAQLEYQWVNSAEILSGREFEARADLYSAYFTTIF